MTQHRPPSIPTGVPLLPPLMTLGGTVWMLLRGMRMRRRCEAAVSSARSEARTDSLTGLPNRRAVLELLDTDHGDNAAMIALLDLDGFKQINDNHGHAAGDDVLVVIAERLDRAARADGARAARLAGDEFLLTWRRHPAPGRPLAHIRHVLTPVARPVDIDHHRLPIRISIGVAVAGPNLRGRDLLPVADAAMYRAKHERSGAVGALPLLVRAWVSPHPPASADRRSRRDSAPHLADQQHDASRRHISTEE